MSRTTQMVRTVSVALVEQDTGKKYEFDRVKDADLFLDRRHGYVTVCMRKDMMCQHSDGRWFRIIPGQERRVEVPITERGTQLCWDCKNALGGCSWSNGTFTPIEGWTATPSEIPMSLKYATKTYAIRECPQFVHD